MHQKILKFCIERGYLIDKEVCEVLEKVEDFNLATKIIEGLSSELNQKIITKTIINKFSTKIKETLENFDEKKTIEKVCINLGINIEISKKSSTTKEFEPKVVDEKCFINAGKNKVKVLFSPCNVVKKVGVIDFVKHFRVRFAAMKKILQERHELENLTSINKIGLKRQGISIIGLVVKKRFTKNKNVILEIEDLTGKINVLINKNNGEVYEKSKEILLDDTIGIRAVGDRAILFANDLIFPDAYLEEKVKLDCDESAAFISDLHLGSIRFLKDKFLKFINWLNGHVGDENQRNEALKIKYLFMLGDNVDGVGVVPGQEKFLEIFDIKEQYKQLSELLDKIRKDVTIIMCPGQHDGVRLAEPQPLIGKDYGEEMYNLDNLILVSNPSLVEIGCSEDEQNGAQKKGLKVLMYHGAIKFE